MRGGTSRGAFVRAADLPSDPRLRDRVVLALYGSPDRRQIDGIGGADPLTSKLAIVSPSEREDADVDYLFAQVGIDAPVVDFGGNCGNMLAGVGPFAIDEGLIPVREPSMLVRIHNVNTGQVIGAEITVQDGRARSAGDTHIAGVPRAGARILLDFARSAGVLGRGLLPTGRPSELLELAPGDAVRVSLVDAANPSVFVAARDIDATQVELLSPFPPDHLVERLRRIRDAAAARLGLAGAAETAAVESPGIPKVYAVAPPFDYTTSGGRRMAAGDLSLVGRGLAFGVPHAAYATTAAICTAAAARIPGTVVWEQVPEDRRARAAVAIGHPGGVLPVEVSVRADPGVAPVLERAGIERTARRLLAGLAAVPMSVLDA